jgi:hypothetical protein
MKTSFFLLAITVSLRLSAATPNQQIYDAAEQRFNGASTVTLAQVPASLTLPASCAWLYQGYSSTPPDYGYEPNSSLALSKIEEPFTHVTYAQLSFEDKAFRLGDLDNGLGFEKGDASLSEWYGNTVYVRYFDGKATGDANYWLVRHYDNSQVIPQITTYCWAADAAVPPAQK